MIHRVACPFCAQWTEIHEDGVEPGDSWIEDCEVCCHPMKLSFEKSGVRRSIVADRA